MSRGVYNRRARDEKQALHRQSACIGRFGIEPILALTAVVMHRCKIKEDRALLVWATPGCAVYCSPLSSEVAESIASNHPGWIVGSYAYHAGNIRLSHESVVADLQARCSELLTTRQSQCSSAI